MIINAFISLLIKLVIVFAIFFSIPSKIRSLESVNLSIKLIILLITTVSVFRILSICKYNLKISINNSNLIITERIYFEKKFKINTPVDISCRILGRGIGRVLYIRSFKDGSERYFGQQLNSSDQDEIVYWVQSNQ